VWYKLNDLTRFGAIIALSGSSITIVANLVLVPRMSYAGAAWGHLLCYLFMMVFSYFWGRKHYAIPYETVKVLGYLGLALFLFGISSWLRPETLVLRMSLNAALFLSFLVLVFLRERKHLRRVSSS
jgi:O-antigen/teichoic acid export membrane protein